MSATAIAATEITAGPPDGLPTLMTTAQPPVQRISGRDVSKHHNARLSDAHGVDVMHQVHGGADNTESFEAVLEPNTLRLTPQLYGAIRLYPDIQSFIRQPAPLSKYKRHGRPQGHNCVPEREDFIVAPAPREFTPR